MFINYALANSHTATAKGFVDAINQAFLFPLITLMMAAALLVFLYGAFEYVKNSASEDGRQTGRRHIMWGIVGMLVMLSAYSILSIAATTFGVKGDLDNANNGLGSTFTGSGSVTSGSGAGAGSGSNICYDAFGDPYTCGTNPNDGTVTGSGAGTGNTTVTGSGAGTGNTTVTGSGAGSGDTSVTGSGAGQTSTMINGVDYGSNYSLMQSVNTDLSSNSFGSNFQDAFSKALQTNPSPASVNFLQTQIDDYCYMQYVSQSTCNQVKTYLNSTN